MIENNPKVTEAARVTVSAPAATDVQPEFIVVPSGQESQPKAAASDGPVITSPDDGGVLFAGGQHFQYKTQKIVDDPGFQALAAYNAQQAAANWVKAVQDLNQRGEFIGLANNAQVFAGFDGLDSRPEATRGELPPVVQFTPHTQDLHLLAEQILQLLNSRVDVSITLEEGPDGKLHKAKSTPPPDDDYTRSA